MRRSGFSDIIARLAEFISAYPLFCLFVFISVILMLLTMALYFGAYDYKLEKRCARMLVFSMVPVCVWMVYFFKPIFSPLLITLSIWLFFSLTFALNKIKQIKLIKKQRAGIKGWTCKNCKAFNEDVFLVCKECNTHR
ncbi:MAG: hypothetical protein KKD05_08565 [Candidatus Omnitrophica bacterium]|nr:hypothetical protein [Candidatus Omnitrophota bacterium]